jgi:hypothetical protein
MANKNLKTIATPQLILAQEIVDWYNSPHIQIGIRAIGPVALLHEGQHLVAEMSKDCIKKLLRPLPKPRRKPKTSRR